MSVTKQYFDAVFGDVEGYAHLAVGIGPIVKPSGKYGYESFLQPEPFEWPRRAQDLFDEVLNRTRAGAVDVFACPNLLRGTERKRGTAVSRRLLHADVDSNDDALDELEVLGGFAVVSGRPGHLHGYVPLAREVTLGEYELLERALRDHLSADNKISDNDLLRPVGTLNHKATVVDGRTDPYEVTWLIEPDGVRVSPEMVAGLLGVDLSLVGGETCEMPRVPNTTHSLERFDLQQYPDVQRALDKRLGDRSADTQRVVGVCFRAGLRLPQIRWAVSQRSDLQQRLDCERADDDVARMYCTLADEQQVARLAKAADPEADYEAKVDAELVRMRVRQEAKRRIACETESAGAALDLGLLEDVLARPSRPAYRIEEILPTDAATLVVAQRKVGKTTFTLNLARSLITGEPFLGSFMPEPINGRVAYMNYEVSDRQLATWASDVGVPTDRMFVANLRGRRDPLGHPDDRTELANALREHQTEALIVDPFGRAFGGTSQNDAGEVGRWLVNLDRFARSEAGVSDLILTTHAGWNGDRVRGSSAVEDWADSIIVLNKSEGSGQEDRYLRAYGRDVYIEEDRLAFDPQTRLLTLTGSGSRSVVRRASKAEELLDDVVTVIGDNPGCSQAQVVAAVREKGNSGGFQDADVREACKLGEQRGLLRRESLGSGKATKHWLVGVTEPTAVLGLDSRVEESTVCR